MKRLLFLFILSLCLILAHGQSSGKRSVATCTMTVSAAPGTTTINAGNSATINAVVYGGTLPYQYSWSTGSSINPIIVSPNIATVYCVVVTDANSCVDTACATVWVIPAGVQDFYNENSISIFPNPSTGVFTFNSLLPNTSGKFHIIVYDVYGRVVKKDLVEFPAQIDISSHVSGVYFYQFFPIAIGASDKTVASGKLVVE